METHQNYIATEGESWDTSTAHIRRTLLECIALGRKSGMKENLFQFEAFRYICHQSNFVMMMIDVDMFMTGF